MSSTNRGSVRRENDLYATPEAAFRPLLAHLLPGRRFWEPACGDRRLINWLREKPGFEADGDDLANGYDFLKDETMREAIITNPPYSLALEFCDHAIGHAPEVIMLLRLNFLGAQKRFDWWKAHEPSAIYVLSDRPDFTGGGGDSCDYGWFFWSARYSGIHHLLGAPAPRKARVGRKPLVLEEW